MEQEFESRLIPILREGVEIIKMVFYKEMKQLAAEIYPEGDTVYISRLTGSAVNELFGTLNPDPQFVSFREKNRTEIDGLLALVPDKLAPLCIALTDGLRISVLCDYQEGHDHSSLLKGAEKYGILLADRDMPLPHTFLELVRRLGRSFQLITPPPAEENPSGAQEDGK